MAVEKIHIERFLELAAFHPVLDVRSPGEYARGHIPGAISFPLFTDEERKVVGTTYKQQSREAAIKAGLDYFGPRMRAVVEEAEKILQERKAASPGNAADKTLLLHCWRGGMRSGAIAWLLDLYGFKIYSLSGGYKKYRHWVLEQFSSPWTFRILGGNTGSGKTYVLQELARKGETVIDLEALANHKGSAFGNIGLPPQPSQEMFENKLAMELSLKAARGPCWLEDESQRIGLVNIPTPLWQQMRRSQVLFLDLPFEARLDHIEVEYGRLDRERMADAIRRISKRLGPLETKTALALLEAGAIRECFSILLRYYDKFYKKGLYNRENPESLIRVIPGERVHAVENAHRLLPVNQELI